MNKSQITAKQKAEEIFDMLSSTIWEHGAGHESTVSYNKIKELACLFVGGFLSLYDGDYQDKKDKTYWHPYDFWVQVKEEIKKL